MEHLRVDPEILLKRITLQIEDYNYTCFDTMRDYLDISIKIWFSPLNPLACIQLEIATSCFIG